MGHSAAGIYSDEGIEILQEINKDDPEDPLSKKMKINISFAGSPIFRNAWLYSDIAESTKGQFLPFWSPSDIISYPSALNPHSEMILSKHKNQLNDINLRQSVLSMATGVDVPLGYTSFASGAVSNGSLITSFRIQQTEIYSPGIKTTISDSIIHYETIKKPDLQLSNKVLPWYKQQDYKIPEIKLPQNNFNNNLGDGFSSGSQLKAPEVKALPDNDITKLLPDNQLLDYDISGSDLIEPKFSDNDITKILPDNNLIPDYKQPEFKVPEFKVPEVKIPDYKQPDIDFGKIDDFKLQDDFPNFNSGSGLNQFP
jgi:hypothetical protein